ncbi:hypothetical protein BIV57_07140 [Mangrovactinospora gilvigrisea]|uniref:Uncharacterized protein n=1 Tax=Mangrovactinospora gilvigrisea TaxID=1428644 RepID=A0A1J7CEU5_9ACTN|nr:hypothetical protein [Mangrovactinospora gilvigrisea]OIV38210.1 hypothetical protein BIV57_07140 [Mangrovactinospora gilvigrisea]
MSLHQPLTLSDAATGYGATTSAHPRSVLARRWNRLRHGPEAEPGPDPDTGTRQVLSLLEIAEQALAVVPESTRMVTSCGTAAMVPVTVGRRCGEQLNAVQQLRSRLEDLDVSAEYATVADRLVRLLTQHQWLVHRAIGLAFTARPEDRTDAYRARVRGWPPAGEGDPAAELVAIRDELRRWCADIRLPGRRRRAG